MTIADSALTASRSGSAHIVEVSERRIKSKKYRISNRNVKIADNLQEKMSTGQQLFLLKLASYLQ